MKRILSILFGLALVLALVMVPTLTALADYATFDNPNYYYCRITNAPSGTFYRQAGLSPDGTKIVVQKTVGTSIEIVLMNADGTGEAIISPGDSGTGDIYGYMNPFWSDDGTAIGFGEVHNSNPSKIVRYDISSATLTYLYQPVAPLDACNADFLGTSKTSIVFWDWIAADGAADLFTWDGTTLTNITNTTNYSEYEPVSNADGTKIVFWSGETTAEPINTTHTLTYSGATWTKDVGFTPIADSYWATWTTTAATQIALTVMSSKDVLIYDSTGALVVDLSGPGYSSGVIGGVQQWNFFGTGPAQDPNGKFVITSNAGRGATPGRDIIMVSPRTVSVGTYTGGTAYFSPDDGSIVSMAAVPPPATPPVALPYGMFNFTICCMTGSNVTLNITLPGNVPVGTKWYKYNGGAWDALPIGDDNGDAFITVTLTDNNPIHDEDPTVGQIIDQGGPGYPGAVGWETYPVSKARVLLPWIALLAVFILAASLFALRLRQTKT